MKKYLLTAAIVVIFIVLGAVSASAETASVVKVGLRYESSAMASANLENAEGAGYEFGYYDGNRNFVSLGSTSETAITMHAGTAALTAGGTIYMGGTQDYASKAAEEPARYRSFAEAEEAAVQQGGWPAWINGRYSVQRTERFSSTNVVVTRTGSSEILFEFDEGGSRALGVRPMGSSTWFRGYKYPGGFEYSRTGGSSLSVINVVALEDYVKGVVPYEMPSDWPLAALEAQAVCARTFVCGHAKHLRSQGFDVCATQDCQVYYGRGNNTSYPTSNSDQAADNTAGLCLYYNGALVQDAVYHAFDGGATEDAGRVWGTETGYLKGKTDPYESQTTIPNYSYSVTYTAAELTWILDQKGYSVGTVQDAYVSEYTPLGNVNKVTFVGSSGTKTVSGETCRTIFYSSTYKKSVTSMRFAINGSIPSVSGGSSISSGGEIMTSSGPLASLDGAAAITGTGEIETLQGNTAAAVTSSGTAAVTGNTDGTAAPATPIPGVSNGSNNGKFVITGTGSGHNVGMSQYGAKAMAELGYSFRDILGFYYTNITIN